jgi:phosphomevalonate kinase
MSNTDKTTKDEPTTNSTLNFGINLDALPDGTDPALIKLIESNNAATAKMANELEEQRKHREEQEKKQIELNQQEYNLNKKKALAELESLDPELAEEEKDSHLQDIEKAIKYTKRASSKKTNKLTPLGKGAPPKEEEDPIQFAYKIDK